MLFGTPASADPRGMEHRFRWVGARYRSLDPPYSYSFPSRLSRSAQSKPTIDFAS
jgi:hypothetical protein